MAQGTPKRSAEVVMTQSVWPPRLMPDVTQDFAVESLDDREWR